MKSKMTEPEDATGKDRNNRSIQNWRTSLLQLRKSFGLSRRMLKRALHVSETALAKWEKGTSPPAPNNAAKIKMLEKIVEGLARAMKKDFVPTWLSSPNDAVGLSGQVDALPANSMAAGTVPRTGTIGRLYVSVDHFPSGSLALTLVINGRATAIGCTVAASASAQALHCSDTRGSVIVAAGGTISLRAANNRVAYHDLRWSATFA